MHRHEADHLLAHWIEHNESHVRSFRERAGQLREISPEAAQGVEEAAILMEQCTERLKKARQSL
ncbi:MAG: hypothetical protein A4E45_01594 [Methanosaeta sp. PtaB.Bin039]|nr:MAG: hypothetical protein A4E45_01594 [Methanosaeta sp. PtaB.Bin039]OPY45594.1 MAG: hypothetical protein A4E47_00903 [Methanosaeta sp. PtaU1.Bin028]HOT07265.1 hypothetical protein [Methanotrichaceae archaeon]HQF17293.1 hypothetical protein [Methanotrichaceae archaeon]HQI91866.1 hypothetical protein [Methanotrichaceae archaeon]